MRLKLTTKQQAVLDFVRAYIASNGSSPTRKEITHQFGWKSANAAEEYLHRLEERGAIKITRGVARGIQIIDNSPQLDVEKMAQALRVISTWARFDIVENFQRALTPCDVLKLCEEALVRVNPNERRAA